MGESEGKKDERKNFYIEHPASITAVKIRLPRMSQKAAKPHLRKHVSSEKNATVQFTIQSSKDFS